MAYSSYRRHDAKDPFAAKAAAVDRALASKDTPVVDAAAVITTPQGSGATVDPECAPAAGWNGTPEVGRLPLGLGAGDAPTVDPRWRACKRRKFGPRSPMLPADHERAARAWLRARPEARARSPWRWLARWVRDAAAAGEQGAAMRASPLWPMVLERACRKQPTPAVTLRWLALTCGRPLSLRRRDLRATAAAVLRLVSLAPEERGAHDADGNDAARGAASTGASDATSATLAMLGKGATRAKRVRRRSRASAELGS